MKTALFLSMALALAAGLNARPKAAAKPKTRLRAAAKVSDADKNLADFSVQPFSDQGSHVTALRKPGEGFASWDILSAMAFGNLASKPHPAKKLFNLRLELEQAGKADSLFPRASSATAEDFPRWSSSKASGGGVSAEAVLLYPAPDAMVLAANFTNRGRSAIRVRPRVVLAGGGDDVDSQVKLDSKGGVLTLTLDRSKLVQRKLKESVCLLAGTNKSRGIFTAASMKDAENLSDSPLVGLGGFTVTNSPDAFTTLKPGQVLRFPVAISFGPDEKTARLPMSRLWTAWALPKGTALAKAKARWNLTAARLPKPAEARFERLSRAAALTLLMSQYGARAELKNDMFSQAKGFKDAFFSEGLPMAALGFSELDHGAAEAALLELTSFSAAAPAPVPPHSGEELLLWEAAGLPLHGLAAWELYLRDPELGRAGEFLSGMGLHLRNECAWWPPHRDGDGNGLYAYASDEEKPAYAAPSAQVAEGQPALQTYSVGLSSLVAWQMQAAGAMAAAVGDQPEADKLLAQFKQTALALKREARSATGIYEQGLDGMLPYILGLDQELPMARAALASLAASAKNDALPFAENGVFSPWKAYFMLKGLCLFGEQATARAAAAKILAFADGKGMFSAYAADGAGLGAPGDAATAAALLEMALDRQEQEAYLLADTTSLSGRLLQVRSPDGAFYLKRVGLSEAKAPYETLSLASVGGGAILKEGAFVLSADKDVRISLMSQSPLDLSEQKSKKEIFKGTKRADLVLKSKVKYLVTLQKP